MKKFYILSDLPVKQRMRFGRHKYKFQQLNHWTVWLQITLIDHQGNHKSIVDYSSDNDYAFQKNQRHNEWQCDYELIEQKFQKFI